MFRPFTVSGKLKHPVVWSILGSLALAVLAFMLLLNASLLSNSLSTVDMSYERAALEFLRLSPDEERLPHCEMPGLQGRLVVEGPACDLGVPPQSPRCDPVNGITKVPLYTLPFSDEVTTMIIIPGDAANGFKDYLENLDRTSLARLGEQSAASSVLLKSKNISVLQCANYGIVSISQHYFSR